MADQIACMPKILAYHPEIGVKNANGTVSIIKMDLPDFEMTDNILKMLSTTFSARTAGELISKLRSKLTTQKYAATGCESPVIVNGIIDTNDVSDIPIIDHNADIS